MNATTNETGGGREGSKNESGWEKRLRVEDTPVTIKFFSKEEESTFRFNLFKSNQVSVGDIGSGVNQEMKGDNVDLITIHQGKRVIAIGCAVGVFILRTFDLHLKILVGFFNRFNLRDERCTITLPNPLQLQFNTYGDNLGVRNGEGVHLYNTGSPKNAIRVFNGRFIDFRISRRGTICLLDYDGVIYLYKNISDQKPTTPVPLQTRIVSFDFSPAGGRILAGTQDGDIVLYNIEKEQVNTRFVLPSQIRQPITCLRWIDHKVLYISLVPPSDRIPTPRACLMNFSKQKGTLQYQCSVKIFQNHVNRDVEDNNIPETRNFLLKYLDYWNSVLCCTNDCNKLEIFEEYEDGWFPLKWRIANSSQFGRGRKCLGFEVDFSFRIPVGGLPPSPLLIFLQSNGQLLFMKISSLDENDQQRAYLPLEKFSCEREKEEYINQWKRVYEAQVKDQESKKKALEEKKLQIQLDVKERIGYLNKSTPFVIIFEQKERITVFSKLLMDLLV